MRIFSNYAIANFFNIEDYMDVLKLLKGQNAEFVFELDHSAPSIHNVDRYFTFGYVYMIRFGQYGNAE